jgi:hypothetical protein
MGTLHYQLTYVRWAKYQWLANQLMVTCSPVYQKWVPCRGLYSPPRIPRQSARSPHGVRGHFGWQSVQVWAFFAQTHGLRSDCLGLCAESSDWFQYERVHAAFGIHTKITLNKGWTTLSTAEPIATARYALYHCTIVALFALLTCAICVTCGLIGKHIYFYSIWHIWYILDQFFDGNSMAVSILWSD